MEELEIVIETKKRPGRIIFLILWLLVVFIKITGKTTSTLTDIIFTTVSCGVIIVLAWILFGNVKISVNVNMMIVRKRYFGISFWTKTYSLSEIRNLYIAKNTKAETYSSWFGSGTSTPDFLKIYDINPVTLHFDYNGKKIKIGEGLEAFDAESLRKAISRN